ncbi:hypothetical protein CO174_02270 [Candidatus Uhrbacteria bacterium CG_4_9_14_3_um_filter_50_9]|uniref:Uncharacterized protein n=1 Tax=Candidatus Uhrbacteria bacterium CG_4_9_14_3_um_filter_50_9 TaxID=1975035 RepID=A0A2M7XCK9_9BACT|nr:MAG: hypothetical protein CO174_02270 [Candidatus Uhrbacteria bacterium CG_4_9_14_3_um_filter_50_9]
MNHEGEKRGFEQQAREMLAKARTTDDWFAVSQVERFVPLDLSEAEREKVSQAARALFAVSTLGQHPRFLNKEGCVDFSRTVNVVKETVRDLQVVRSHLYDSPEKQRRGEMNPEVEAKEVMLQETLAAIAKVYDFQVGAFCQAVDNQTRQSTRRDVVFEHLIKELSDRDPGDLFVKAGVFLKESKK